MSAVSLTTPSPASTTRSDLRGWALGTGLLVVLIALLPVLFTRVYVASFSNPAVWLAYLVVVYSSVRLSLLFVRGAEALVQLTFWAFVYLFFGLGGLAGVSAGRFPIPFQFFSNATEVHALLGIVIGLLAFDVGSALARRMRRPPQLERSLTRFAISPARVWALGGVGTLAVVYFTLRDGLATRFTSRARATQAFFGDAPTGLRVDQIQGKATGLIESSALWLPIFLALFLLCYLRWGARRGEQPTRSARHRLVTSNAARNVIIVLAVGNVIANNPLSNARFRFGGVSLALLLAVFPMRRPALWRWGVVAFLLLLLFVYPYAAAFRYDKPQFKLSPLREQLLDSADYSMFQQEMNAVVYIDKSGHTFGRQAEGAFLIFIPRAIWPGKPVDTGNLISRTEVINLSSSLWAEANVDGGWIGIGLVLFSYGWLSQLFDAAYTRRPRGTPSVVGAAVPLYAAFQTFVLRGALQPAIGELMPVAIIFGLCLAKASRKTRPGSQVDTTPEPLALGARG